MAKNTRQTGAKTAAAASKVLRNPRSTKAEKSAAASALSQTTVADLGATLIALASSPAHRHCLEVFADTLKAEALRPLFLTVLVEPRGGAQIFMVGRVCPGMTLQVDADLQLNMTQLWYGEGERDD